MSSHGFHSENLAGFFLFSQTKKVSVFLFARKENDKKNSDEVPAGRLSAPLSLLALSLALEKLFRVEKPHSQSLQMEQYEDSFLAKLS